MEKNNLKIVLSVVTIMTSIAFIFSLIELFMIAYLNNVHVSNLWNIDPSRSKNISYLFIPILVLSIFIAIILITMIVLQITKYKNDKLNLILSSILLGLILIVFVLTLIYLNEFIVAGENYDTISNTQFTPFVTIYESTFGIIINSLIPTLIIFISTIYNKLHKKDVVKEEKTVRF